MSQPQPPKRRKTDKMPYISQRSQHRRILFYGLLPLLVHQIAIITLNCGVTSPRLLSATGIFANYALFFFLAVRQDGLAIKSVARQIGYLDGDVHPRDRIPHGSKTKVFLSLPALIGLRTALTLVVAYNPSSQPIGSLSRPGWWVWLFFNISIYCIILDFWYYCAHRACHEIHSLWKFHSLHHTTKHPIMRLASYADLEQEIFDTCVAPLLAYLTMRAANIPLDFYSWWICLQYAAHSETAGHSGMRAYLTAPLTFSRALQSLGAEIVIEDHDLHHRKGYRKTCNYGKQSRLWDLVFGTRGERLETIPANLDWNWGIDLPLFGAYQCQDGKT